MMDVMAFMGKVKSNPGICETVSQNNIMMEPTSSVAPNKTL